MHLAKLRPLLLLLMMFAAAFAATPEATTPCLGEACDRMTALLPQMRWRRRFYRIKCDCKDYEAGVCFAQGCFPCAKSCFTGPDAPLADLPGPFGSGLLCSTGCRPCCQRKGAPEGCQRCRFLAAGMFDGTVRVLIPGPRLHAQTAWLRTQAAGASQEPVLLLDSAQRRMGLVQRRAAAHKRWTVRPGSYAGVSRGLRLRTGPGSALVSGSSPQPCAHRSASHHASPTLPAADARTRSRGARARAVAAGRAGAGGAPRAGAVRPALAEVPTRASVASRRPKVLWWWLKNTLRVLALERLGEFYHTASRDGGFLYAF